MSESIEEQLRRQLATLKNDFDNYRRRSQDELAEATQRARDEIAVSLTELVDDCDRALEMTYADSDHNRLLDGLKQMRDRAIGRFAKIGLSAFGKVGDDFDPHLHNAIAAEPAPGKAGRIIKVHQRGWRREDGTVVRTAMVTVSNGSGAEPDAPAAAPAIDDAEPRRRHQPSAPFPAGPERCEFGVPGCVGDCPDCRLKAESGGGR